MTTNELSEAEKNTLSWAQDLGHPELVSEYMDLHAAYLNAEKVIGRYERAMQDIGLIIDETNGDIE